MQVTPQEQRQCGKRLWSKEEDQLLLSLVTNPENPKWATISKQFNQLWKQKNDRHISERTNKQCRQRWQNHLNPAIKNNKKWENDEHRALFKLFRQKSHKWCELAKELQDQGFQKRSDNNIKNYFYSALKRQVKKLNEVIREHNKQTKKTKSEKHNYSAKYAYKQRLSLQRQVHLSQSIAAESNEQSSEVKLKKKKQKSEEDGLHIIKELQPQLISKILLIAEDKADKKYIISSNHSEKYRSQASESRNQLIDLIIEMDDKQSQQLQKKEVLELAKTMLEISRKCKKKTINKQSPTKVIPQETVRLEIKKEQKDFGVNISQNNKSPTQKSFQLMNHEQYNPEQFFKEANEVKKPMELINSQSYSGYQNHFGDICFNNFHQSFDFSHVIQSGNFQESGFYNMNPQFPPILLASHSSFLDPNDKERQTIKKPSFMDAIGIRVEEKHPVNLSPQFFDNNNINNENNLFTDQLMDKGHPTLERREPFMYPPHLSTSCPGFEPFSSQQMPKFQNGAFDLFKKQPQHHDNNFLSRSWVYTDHTMKMRPNMYGSQQIGNISGNLFHMPTSPSQNNPYFGGNLFHFPPSHPPKDNNDQKS